MDDDVEGAINLRCEPSPEIDVSAGQPKLLQVPDTTAVLTDNYGNVIYTNQ